MGRQSGLGKLIVKAAKTAMKETAKAQREAERERKRQSHVEAKRLREHERSVQRERKAIAKTQRDEEKRIEKERKQAEKVAAKERKEYDKNVLNSLTEETITRFGLGEVKERYSSLEVDYSLDREIRIVSSLKGGEYFKINRKVKVADVDELLLSGRFNSVMGPDGFKFFKSEIKKIVESVNKKSNKDNFINLDNLFEILLHSGLHYELNHLPKGLDHLDDDTGWLTAYRFISRNFKGITYKDFRTLVKAIKKTDGHTLEFDTSEQSSDLYKKISGSELFEGSVSAQSILATRNMRVLRDICNEFNVASKRSKEETISELLSKKEVVEKIEEQFQEKATGLVFTIKDYDLVKGEDIVMLDKYLRDVAKIFRSELFEFVNSKQSYKLVG